MSGRSEESRTFVLDRQVISDLCSPVAEVREEAMSQLPDALTRQELEDVGIQVSLVPESEAIKRGRELEREALFHIGVYALFMKQDIVTAENTARELRSKGIMGIVGSLLLKTQLRKVKKEVIDLIIDTDEQ